ncbi:hypothetical protein A0J61_11403, partial [Choanephora cucurbitarum]
NHVRRVINPEALTVRPVTDKVTALSEASMSKYLKEWGFEKKSNGKDYVYFDGYERDDVRLYRLDWARKMMMWREKMEVYPRDNEEEALEPIVQEGEKKKVLVTHDESTFYANDARKE